VTKKADITPLTKIGELLDSYPELEEILIAQAPAFKKLSNPVLRRTVARIATVEKAAGIAGIPARELVRTLRNAVGLDVEVDTGDRSTEPGTVQEPAVLPAWVDAKNVRETIDADALLDAGVVPLARVLTRARELKGSDLLRVDSSFRPAPLTEKLHESGFRCHVHAVDSERFETYIGARMAEQSGD